MNNTVAATMTLADGVNVGLVIAIIAIALIIILVFAYIVSNNRFISQRNTVEESWRQIDVELQRRHDLIGNLVEVVKASARFEQNTLVQVVQARSQAMATRGAGPLAQSQAEQTLNGALTNLLSIAENYPELKANQDFINLQNEMTECEDRIAAGRRFYNGNVRAYNTRIDSFPSSIVASMGKFQKAQYYEVDDPRVRMAPSLAGAFDSLNAPITPLAPANYPQQAPQGGYHQSGPFPQQQMPSGPYPQPGGYPQQTPPPGYPQQGGYPQQPPSGPYPQQPGGYPAQSQQNPYQQQPGQQSGPYPPAGYGPPQQH